MVELDLLALKKLLENRLKGKEVSRNDIKSHLNTLLRASNIISKYYVELAKIEQEKQDMKLKYTNAKLFLNSEKQKNIKLKTQIQTLKKNIYNHIDVRNTEIKLFLEFCTESELNNEEFYSLCTQFIENKKNEKL